MQDWKLNLDILAKELFDSNYLVAEQFTLADICYAPFLPYLSLMGITPPEELNVWIKTLISRESVQAVLPDIKIY